MKKSNFNKIMCLFAVMFTSSIPLTACGPKITDNESNQSINNSSNTELINKLKGDQFSRSGVRFKVLSNNKYQVIATIVDDNIGLDEWRKCNDLANNFYKKIDGCSSSRLFKEAETKKYKNIDFSNTKTWWLADNYLPKMHYAINESGEIITSKDSTFCYALPICFFNLNDENITNLVKSALQQIESLEGYEEYFSDDEVSSVYDNAVATLVTAASNGNIDSVITEEKNKVKNAILNAQNNDSSGIGAERKRALKEIEDLPDFNIYKETEPVSFAYEEAKSAIMSASSSNLEAIKKEHIEKVTAEINDYKIISPNLDIKKLATGEKFIRDNIEYIVVSNDNVELVAIQTNILSRKTYVWGDAYVEAGFFHENIDRCERSRLLTVEEANKISKRDRAQQKKWWLDTQYENYDTKHWYVSESGSLNGWSDSNELSLQPACIFDFQTDVSHYIVNEAMQELYLIENYEFYADFSVVIEAMQNAEAKLDEAVVVGNLSLVLDEQYPLIEAAIAKAIIEEQENNVKLLKEAKENALLEIKKIYDFETYKNTEFVKEAYNKAEVAINAATLDNIETILAEQKLLVTAAIKKATTDHNNRLNAIADLEKIPGFAEYNNKSELIEVYDLAVEAINSASTEDLENVIATQKQIVTAKIKEIYNSPVERFRREVMNLPEYNTYKDNIYVVRAFENTLEVMNVTSSENYDSVSAEQLKVMKNSFEQAKTDISSRTKAKEDLKSVPGCKEFMNNSSVVVKRAYELACEFIDDALPEDLNKVLEEQKLKIAEAVNTEKQNVIDDVKNRIENLPLYYAYIRTSIVKDAYNNAINELETSNPGSTLFLADGAVRKVEMAINKAHKQKPNMELLYLEIGYGFERNGIQFIVVKKNNLGVIAIPTKSLITASWVECEREASELVYTVKGCESARILTVNEFNKLDDPVRRLLGNTWLYDSHELYGHTKYCVSTYGKLSFRDDTDPYGVKPAVSFKYDYDSSNA